MMMAHGVLMINHTLSVLHTKYSLAVSLGHVDEIRRMSRCVNRGGGGHRAIGKSL